MNDLANSLPRQHRWRACSTRFGRTGPLASMGLYVGALVRSDQRLERPDLQINMFAWSDQGAEPRTASVPHPFSGLRPVSPVHLRPDGRGTVRLKIARSAGARRRSASTS